MLQSEAAGTRPERAETHRLIAEAVAEELNARLGKLEATGEAVAYQVQELSTWFRETPSNRSLPARVAELETAYLFQQNELSAMRTAREGMEREQVRGYWSAVAAIIAAGAAIIAALVPAALGRH